MSNNKDPMRDEWKVEAEDDLKSIEKADPALAEAALSAVDDLVNRRKVGSELGKRRTSGDLTGLFRLKFDLPGARPERYRIIYQVIGDDSVLIWGLGERASQWIYRLVESRR
ncbi:MAG: type II toxin-antitoxin system RelE/ParE family toxin [Propionibacteriaceae bacterium]|jgi:mRNA-degrading endonuclease RelE of RelBE toxin-antitoxin system|nr:type II toxin-antitoxin system RelE/ParE family toxin [Propionibacteriaceae bacterium]